MARNVALTLALLLALAVRGPAQERPKTIILGFDGMSHGLARQFMEAGELPRLAELAEAGGFRRLETSNPAQSPVSWAVFNTGSNPGKTGVGGFVSRTFARKDGVRSGNPSPQPMLGFADSIPATDFVMFPMAVESPETFTVAAAVAALAAAFLLLRFLVRLPALVALLLGLGAGAGGWYLALGYTASLPADGELPYEVNPMQGTNFWTQLDEAGVRLMGIQVASTYPPDDEGPATKLLSGLGVKDISGSPGSWFVYTDDPWSWEKSTNTAGKIIKVYFDQNDMKRARAELIGPNNWIEEARLQEAIEALEAQEGSPDNTAAEQAAHAEALEAAKAEYAAWRKDKATKVPFVMDVDRAAGTLEIEVQGTRISLETGGWSDFVPVTFAFNDRFAAHGVVRFHLIRCDDEDVRVFVPPINIDPYQPPEWLPISAPPAFSAEIAEGIGSAYETLGWACMTNPLKDRSDSQFEAQSFLDDIVATMSGRERVLDWALDRAGEWDVYYQVFSTPDRVAHMLYREFDPGHPVHDVEYAASEVTAWGRTFPLSQSVPETYKEVDRIVGGVLDRMEAGEFGDDCLLMVVSDHGFTSFRRGVNLNNLLYDLGYLKTKDDKPLSSLKGVMRDLLMYVDWERTQAYSMGLGKVFINLEGREPKGIVDPAEYDDVVAAIRRDLLQVTDADGTRVVTSASRRDELFEGPWWKEGEAERKKRGQYETVEHDGFADLFIGYAPYYRVSWANTLGGVDDAAIVDNTNHWSGGHVSVDPVHVPGVLFTNRPFAEEAQAGLIDIGPTVVARYGLDPAATDMDGRPLPVEDLTQ